MSAVQQQPPSDYEVTAREVAAIDRVLGQIDRRNAHLESFAYWKLALKFFKELDLRYALMVDPSAMELFHRAILTSMLAATESLCAFTSRVSSEDLARISLSKETLEANLKYLRSKYQQWYAYVDPRTIETVNKAIENGTGSTPRGNLQDAA